ncbi:nuclear transport factor 2 family protein [Mycobacterium sp. Z3061]|uniref:nuclear transport factor 2 family protein n=1 Tax=Mycobacterium sp. Z3061 TaxID=3073562 RepID=UPI002873AB26|nr:nuclear transport factor 2 family protein [Mycobacterium sp. Z3061]
MTVNELADRLFSAIEKGDRETVASMWGDDVAVWRTDGRRDPTTCDDKPRALRVIDWFLSTTATRGYEILDRQVFENGFVQQHVLHATGHGGQSIAMRVCIVIKVDKEGLINHIDEYFDPADLAPLLVRDSR